MQWQLYEQNPQQHKLLLEGLDVSPVTASVLINRGIKTREEAEKFLNPSLQHMHDPFLFLDMDKAVYRIIKAIKNKEQITICGDYDADGVCSTALLIVFFKMVGVDVDYYIPHRINDGYGLNCPAVESLKNKGTNLIITVDNGISTINAIGLANKLGVDVIVTDHHEPPEKLPDALAIINPKRKGCGFPFKELAGVGIAFNLAIALRQRLRENDFFGDIDEPKLKHLLEIVAIGTIADVAPLLDENRVFVKFGLEELKKSSNCGLSALKAISGLEPQHINSTTIAFRLAPRINAAGRVDDHSLGVDLLTTDSPENATELAQKMQNANVRRQSIEGKILTEAENLIKSDAKYNDYLGLVLAKEGWHQGVIGIVANRISDAHKKPTVIIGIENGVGRGSIRSVGNFNVMEVLNQCSDLLTRFGGHKHAAGITIEEKNIDAFEKRFNKIVSAALKDRDRIDSIMVDAEINPEMITESLMSELELMEPFGEGNPEPIFSTKDLKVSMSRIIKEKHLKLKFTENMITLDAIGFGMAKHNILKDDVLDVAFIPQRDTWRGNGAIQLKLKDLNRKRVH